MKDPHEAAAYLDAVMEDCNDDELLLALGNVAEARFDNLGNLQKISEQELIQAILSSRASLDLVALRQTLSEMGLRLSVTPVKNAA